VTEPAAHTRHTASASVLPRYIPALQAVQLRAPASTPVSVWLPALHSSHALTDTLEYLPAAHAVQTLPPAEASVLVTLPGGQSAHAIVETDPNMPGEQGVQALPPATESVSVIEPAVHKMQASAEEDPPTGKYLPAVQPVQPRVASVDQYPAGQCAQRSAPAKVPASV